MVCLVFFFLTIEERGWARQEGATWLVGEGVGGAEDLNHVYFSFSSCPHTEAAGGTGESWPRWWCGYHSRDANVVTSPAIDRYSYKSPLPSLPFRSGILVQLRFLGRSLISRHVPDLAYIFGRGFYLFIVVFFFAGEVDVPWISFFFFHYVSG